MLTASAVFFACPFQTLVVPQGSWVVQTGLGKCDRRRREDRRAKMLLLAAIVFHFPLTFASCLLTAFTYELAS